MSNNKDTSPNALQWCEQNGACRPAKDWIRENGIQTMNEAWEKCPYSEWLEWVIEGVAATVEARGRQNEADEIWDRMNEVFYEARSYPDLPKRSVSFYPRGYSEDNQLLLGLWRKHFQPVP